MWRRSLLGLALAGVFAVGAPARLLAFSAGITGYSGKSGASVVCNACHSGGTSPDVAITGPSVMDPGTMATFRFTLTSNGAQQTGSGFNLSASAGTLAVVTAADTQKLGTELTHKQTKVNSGGQAFWDFTFQAPAGDAFYVLYASGNSVNRNQAQTGDRSASTTHVIQVGNPPTWTPTNSPSATRTRTGTRTGTPTRTPTVTLTATMGAVPSATHTAAATATPSHTNTTALTATATVTPLPCFGDCDGDRALSESDLGRIRSALLLCGPCAGDVAASPAAGCAAALGCPAADFDQDQCLSAGELTRLIDAILTGASCP